MRCTAAMIVSLALGAMLCAEAHAQQVEVGPIIEREITAEDREASREWYKGLRELIVRKLMGEDVCSEELVALEHQVVCTPEGIFEWEDPDFTPRCQRCARYKNPFAYQMCMDGRIKGAPRTILGDHPC